MSETPELRVFEFSEEAGGEEDRPATDDEIRAAVVPLLDLEAAARGIYDTFPSRPSWSWDHQVEGVKDRYRKMARGAVYAALGLGEDE